eukprot:m.330829 g.330829  ORF g.330829 m.330829 type:complete len:344 (+) comp19768_c4_seq2:1791-2822(+)
MQGVRGPAASSTKPPESLHMAHSVSGLAHSVSGPAVAQPQTTASSATSTGPPVTKAVPLSGVSSSSLASAPATATSPATATASAAAPVAMASSAPVSVSSTHPHQQCHPHQSQQNQNHQQRTAAQPQQQNHHQHQAHHQQQQQQEGSRPSSAFAVGRESAIAIAEKLRAIKEEFSDNNLVLEQMRSDVRHLVAQSGLYNSGLDLDPAMARPLSRSSNVTLFRDLQDLRLYQGLLLRGGSGTDRSALQLDLHLGHLKEFIEEQHDEVEALRRLQTTLMEGSHLAVNPRLDPVAYRALLQVMGVVAADGPTHEEKTDYFDLLVGTVLAEGEHNARRRASAEHLVY